jgi:murein L,D-transpeptidase YafK
MNVYWKKARGFLKRRRRAVVATGIGIVVAGTALAGLAIWQGCHDDPAPRAEAIPAPLENPRILVEKRAHRLSLFDGDRLVRTYRAAVGEGRRDKVREGDRCTPEGDFYVCYKNPQSKYVLSLGLSYPNEEDAERGLRSGLITREQQDAIVSAVRDRSMDANTWEALWKTPLGGEIMIHGCGAGRDWTAGCVALDDDAIRELYRVVPYGTPVKIVP